MLAAACAASVAVVAAGGWVLSGVTPPATRSGDPAVQRTHRPPSAADVAVISRTPAGRPHTTARTGGRSAPAKAAPAKATPAKAKSDHQGKNKGKGGPGKRP